METLSGDKTENKILRRLFRKSEISYTVSDISKAIGPMIDLFFISQFIGANGVTVIGYVSPLIMLLELIGTAISSGARNKVSSLIGSGNLDEANRAFSGSVFMGAGLSLLVSVLIMIFCSAVSFVLGAKDPAAFEMTKQYIYGYMFGFPFFTLTRILTPYLQMEGQYLRVNITSALTTVIDIAADAFVVFIIRGGMFQIGLATSLGYIIPFFVGASFFLNRKKRSVFRLSPKGISVRQCVEIFRLGAPSGVIKGSNAVGGMLINNMLTAVNMPFLVAAYGVFSQATVFLRSSWYAPADTLHAFSGVFIGEEDKNSLKEIQKTAFFHALLFTSIVTAALFAFASPISSVLLKSDDPEALKISTECIRVACFSLPFHAVVYNFNNYLMAVKKIRFCCLYSFLLECGCLAPITFIMLQLMGYHGAWTAKIVNMLVVSLIAVFYICIHKGGKTFRDKMLLLPGSFGIPRENEIAVLVTSTMEFFDLSRVAIAFAMDHGADKKRAQTFGLIAEELSLFYSEHRFSDGKPHHINTRLIAKDDDLIIRIRDDCKPFNVTDYYQALKDSENIEKKINLTIIMEMAKDIQYTAAFGANNLIVRV